MPRPCFQCVMAGLRRYGSTYVLLHTQPVFSVHLLFFCLQDMVFLSWAHFFSSLLRKDFLVRFSPYQQTQKPLFWRPALTSSATHFFASLMPHHSIFFLHFFLKRETDLVKIDCLVSRIFCLRSIAHQIWCIEILDQLRHEALPLSRCDTLLKNRDFIQTASIR